MWLLSCGYCRGCASMLCVSCIYMRVPVDADTARRADGKSAGMTADRRADDSSAYADADADVVLYAFFLAADDI